jgi:large subunit ribosomal protein L21
MYVIVDIQGFQYRLRKGDTIRVPRINSEVGGRLTLDEVLLVSDNEKVMIGEPFVAGAAVEAKVTDHGRYDKIIVFKKKRRKDYSVKRGHRQDFTEIEITGITLPGSAKAAKAAKAKAAPEPAPVAVEEAVSGKA